MRFFVPRAHRFSLPPAPPDLSPFGSILFHFSVSVALSHFPLLLFDLHRSRTLTQGHTTCMGKDAGAWCGDDESVGADC